MTPARSLTRLRRTLVTLLATSLAPLAGAAQEVTAPEPPAAPAEVPARSDADTAQGEATIAARQTYLRLMEERRYDEALEIASQLADLTAQLTGERSVEHATALGDLATAHREHGNLPEAEAGYRACIAIIERAEGVGSPLLIAPLTGLGDTYVRAGLYPQARQAYELALRANHAAAGFYNLEQIPIMDGLAESYLGLNKLPEANAQQRNQVVIVRRRSGAESPDTVPALYKLARWYNRTGQFVEARAAYQTARRIIRASGDGNDPAVVDALIGESLTYLNEGAVPASAAVLQQALAVLDEQPQPDPLKRAEVLVSLGDLYTLSGQPRSARERYGQAWQVLSGDEALLAQRDQYFARPSRITGPRLPDFVDAGGRPISGGGKLVDGYVLAALTVDASGVARDPVIVESAPPGLLDKQLLRTLRDTAFRPQLRDGQPIATENAQYRHAFRYRPASERDGGKSKSEETDNDSDKAKPIAYPGSDADAGS
jgi:tetratricopeptide (TPR) repeat protein